MWQRTEGSEESSRLRERASRFQAFKVASRTQVGSESTSSFRTPATNNEIDVDVDIVIATTSASVIENEPILLVSIDGEVDADDKVATALLVNDGFIVDLPVANEEVEKPQLSPPTNDTDKAAVTPLPSTLSMSASAVQPTTSTTNKSERRPTKMAGLNAFRARMRNVVGEIGALTRQPSTSAPSAEEFMQNSLVSDPTRQLVSMLAEIKTCLIKDARDEGESGRVTISRDDHERAVHVINSCLNIFRQYELTPLAEPLPTPASPSLTKSEDVIRRVSIDEDSTNAAIEDLSHLSQRERIEKEILDSEAVFVSQLRMLLEGYLIPLSKVGRFDVAAFNNVLASVDVIYQYNTNLLGGLQQIIQIPKHEDDPTPTGSIGKVFLEMAPFMKVYSDYIVSCEAAIAAFNNLMKTTAFANYINELYSKLQLYKGDSLAVDIPSLLICPVQRIPRYALLLQELLRNTPEEHPDFESLTRALMRIKDAAEHINNSQKQTDMRKKMLEIQSSIEGSYLNIVEPHRTFVREGLMGGTWLEAPADATNSVSLANNTSTSNSSESPIPDYMFFLFTDLLLFALPKKKMPVHIVGRKTLYEYKGFFLLANIVVKDVPDTEDLTNAIELECQEDEFADEQQRAPVFQLRTKSLADKTEWMKVLTQQVAACRLANREVKNDMFKPALKQGYLMKRGKNVKNWKRRYFRLKGGSLFYYEAQKDNNPISGIVLAEHSLHMAEDKMKRTLCIELRPTSLTSLQQQRDENISVPNGSNHGIPTTTTTTTTPTTHNQSTSNNSQPTGRSYFMQADSIETCHEWVTALFFSIAWIDSDVADRFLDRTLYIKHIGGPKILLSSAFTSAPAHAPQTSVSATSTSPTSVTSLYEHAREAAQLFEDGNYVKKMT